MRFALLLFLAAPLAAQTGGSAPRPVSLVETAERLAREGFDRGDARSVLAAAEILGVVERGTRGVRTMDSTAFPGGPWQGGFTRANLLALAARIARDRRDSATADEIAWLRSRNDSLAVTRGATAGPVWADTYLPGGSAVRYGIEFAGGQTPNQLRVSASKPGAVLECTLTEATTPDVVAARVNSLAGTCIMEWKQRSTARMILLVRNRGGAAYLVIASN